MANKSWIRDCDCLSRHLEKNFLNIFATATDIEGSVNEITTVQIEWLHRTAINV